MQPLGYLNLLGRWDLINGDELQVLSPVLLPIAHEQTDRVDKIIWRGQTILLFRSPFRAFLDLSEQ